MDRIATANRSVDLFGAGKDGFDGGDPLEARDGTDLSAEFCNGVQESIVRVIEAAGITPDAADYDQLVEALGVVSQSGELVYVDPDGSPAPKTRTVILSPLGGVVGISGGTMAHWGLASANDSYMSAHTDNGWIGFSLDWLPEGATLTRVRVLVDPGAARASTARMQLKVQKRTPSFSSPAAGSTTDVAAVFDNESASIQVIDSGVFSEAVSKSTGKLMIARVEAGDTASSASDILHAIEITFTDPGPRNH
jgi:hypothetical protein